MGFGLGSSDLGFEFELRQDYGDWVIDYQVGRFRVQINRYGEKNQGGKIIIQAIILIITMMINNNNNN